MSLTEELIADEVEKQIGSLEDLPFGSEEHHKGVQDIAILVEQKNNIKKIELEYQDKAETRRIEEEIRRQEIRKAKFDNIMKCVTAIGIPLTYVGVTIWVYLDDKKFETDGYMRTTEGGKTNARKLFNLIDILKK